MKTKISLLKRKQRVYYFEHRHGVLKAKGHLGYNIIGSVMLACVLLVGSAWVVNGIIHRPADGSIANYQRENLSVSQTTQTDQSEDGLKSVVTKAREDEQLAKQIRSKLKNVPGGQQWSVYVRDLNSDRMAGINADDMIEASGLSNLFLLAPLEAKVPASNWNYRASKMTLAKCVEAMVNSNDAACAQAVSQYSDLKNADSINQGLGFRKTTITAKKQETTAREVGDLLFRLQNSQVLSDKARRTVFDGLYGQKLRDSLPASCEQKCLVAHAISESKTSRSDAAIVTAGESKYVVVIMAKDGSWGQIAGVSADIRLLMQP